MYRFWAWINSGWVKLSIEEEGHLEISTGGPNEEGFNWVGEFYSLEDGELSLMVTTTGRDCDGPYSYTNNYFHTPGDVDSEFNDEWTTWTTMEARERET